MNSQFYTILFITLFLIGLIVLFVVDKKNKPWEIDKVLLNFRTTAIIPILFFVPTIAIAAVNPTSKLSDALGIFFHLAVIIVASRIPTYSWSKGSAFCWLALDVACGAMTMNGVPLEIAMPVRLGGHLLGAMWIIPTSLISGKKSLKILGSIAGVWLTLYTFFGNVLPITFLAPAGIPIALWFGVLAWNYKETPVLTSKGFIAQK